MIWSLLNSIPQFQYTGDYAICGGCDDLPHSNATLFRSLLLCCTRRFVTIARLSTLLSFFLWVKHFIARKFFSRRCKKISTSYSRSLLTLQRPYMGWNTGNQCTFSYGFDPMRSGLGVPLILFDFYTWMVQLWNVGYETLITSNPRANVSSTSWATGQRYRSYYSCFLSCYDVSIVHDSLSLQFFLGGQSFGSFFQVGAQIDNRTRLLSVKKSAIIYATLLLALSLSSDRNRCQQP